MKKAKRLARKVIYRNPWVNLYVDKVHMPSGQLVKEFHYLHFETSAVGVLVEDLQGRFLLEKVYRYATDTTTWEIPAGGIEKGESPVEAATREVYEETGYELLKPKLIYSYFPMNGMSDKVYHLVKARAGRQTGPIDPHEVQALQWMSPKELHRQLKTHQIRDGLTLSALLFVQSHKIKRRV